VLRAISQKTKVKLIIGESGTSFNGGHILITSPGFIKSRLESSKKGVLDLSALKMIVYDEADELFIQVNNQPAFEVLVRHLLKNKLTPQHCLFSATFTDDVIQAAKAYIGDFKAFPIKKEALKLKGVKSFKIELSKAAKLDFIAKVHTSLERSMTMVFVNTKSNAVDV
jgi:superfamily II DNA/RNA helicase